MKLSLDLLKKGAMTVRNVIGKNSPAITAGIAIVAMGGAIFASIRATKKVEDALLDAYKEKNKGVETVEEAVELTKTEKAIVFARCYWPAAVLVLLSASCMIGSVCLANHQIRALAVVASTAESALGEYQKAAVDVIGEKKAEDIKDQVNKNRVMANPPKDDEIIDTRKGNSLCYDPLSGRYFRSDIDSIRAAINELNTELLDMQFVSVNDYYEALGLEPTKYDSDRGWHYDSGDPRGAQIRVHYTSAKVRPGTSDTAFVVDIQTEPRYDYTDCMY